MTVAMTTETVALVVELWRTGLFDTRHIASVILGPCADLNPRVAMQRIEASVATIIACDQDVRYAAERAAA